jgi:hypothetical protein
LKSGFSISDICITLKEHHLTYMCH